jgi:O-antigen/teichoic acid export membrane protein
MEIEEYGDYVLIQGFIALSGLILSQNIYSYARLKIPGANTAIQYGYLKTILVIVVGLFLFVLFMSFVFGLEENLWNFFEIQNSLTFLVLLMLGFELINLEFMRFFIAIKKIYLKNYAQFFQKIFTMLGSLLLLYFKILSLSFFLYLYIAGQFVVFLIFISNVNLKDLIFSSLMEDVVYNGYKVALPLIPIGIMSIALNYTDTLMIAKFIGKEAVAQYGFASQIISIMMMMIGTSIVLTLFPHATEAHNKNETELRDMFFSKMFKYGIALSIIFYLLINLTSSWFISFLEISQYKDVSSYLLILALFPFFQHLYNVSSHYLQLMKVFNLQIYIAILVMFENLVLNYFMIKEYAIIGAAYASLISFATLSLIFIYLALKHYKK